MLISSSGHHPQVITLACCIRRLWFSLFGDEEREDSAGSLSPERRSCGSQQGRLILEIPGHPWFCVCVVTVPFLQRGHISF